MPFGGSENRPHTLQQCRRAARRRSGLRGDGARGLAIVPTAHGPRSESTATAVQEPVAINAAGGSEPIAEQSEMTLTNPHQRRSAKTARRAPATRRDETTEGPDSSRSPRRAGRPRRPDCDEQPTDGPPAKFEPLERPTREGQGEGGRSKAQRAAANRTRGQSAKSNLRRRRPPLSRTNLDRSTPEPARPW